MGSFGKIVHSLRFQLPAVVAGVFVGMLFLLMLFFHEMGKILVKTRQLAQSAEINDMVAIWNAGLSSSARERTKLMSLGNESYLRSFQVSLNEVNDLYSGTMRWVPDTLAKSTRELRGLHRQASRIHGAAGRLRQGPGQPAAGPRRRGRCRCPPTSRLGGRPIRR